MKSGRAARMPADVAIEIIKASCCEKRLDALNIELMAHIFTRDDLNRDLKWRASDLWIVCHQRVYSEVGNLRHVLMNDHLNLPVEQELARVRCQVVTDNRTFSLGMLLAQGTDCSNNASADTIHPCKAAAPFQYV